MSTQEEMEKKYPELFSWSNNTMVEMEEDYVYGVQKKPIRNLFGDLKYSYKNLIRMLFDFILGDSSEITPEERRGLEMRDFTPEERIGLIKLGHDINAVFEQMNRKYKEMPKDNGRSIVDSDAYEKFIEEKWNPTIDLLNREYSGNDFVTHLLERYRFMNEPVFFQPRQVRNLQTLFATIVKMPRRPLLIQLRETFNDEQYYNTWYGPKLESEGGGRKLSRRRKTNPKSKSKSKHKHKRRSYKKRLRNK